MNPIILAACIPYLIQIALLAVVAATILWPSEKRVRRAQQRQEAERRAKQRRLWSVGRVVRV